MKKLFSLSIVIVLAFLMLMLPLSAAAAENETFLSIYACNLSFNDGDVVLKYAVDSTNNDTELLIFTEAKAAYTKAAGPAYTLTNVGYQKISGKWYMIFDLTGIETKNFVDDIYAVAYCNGNYGGVLKYSKLQYAYNKTGKTGTATSNRYLIDLINYTLNDVAAAQTAENYKTDRLATAAYYQIKLNGGTFADGSDCGLFLSGDVISASAPATLGAKSFVGWKNSKGITVSNETSLSITVGDENESFTPSYASECELSGHEETEVRNAKAADYDHEGYTGDTYCTACGEIISRGNVTPILGLMTKEEIRAMIASEHYAPDDRDYAMLYLDKLALGDRVDLCIYDSAQQRWHRISKDYGDFAEEYLQNRGSGLYTYGSLYYSESDGRPSSGEYYPLSEAEYNMLVKDFSAVYSPAYSMLEKFEYMNSIYADKLAEGAVYINYFGQTREDGTTHIKISGTIPFWSYNLQGIDLGSYYRDSTDTFDMELDYDASGMPTSFELMVVDNEDNIVRWETFSFEYTSGDTYPPIDFNTPKAPLASYTPDWFNFYCNNTESCRYSGLALSNIDPELRQAMKACFENMVPGSTVTPSVNTKLLESVFPDKYFDISVKLFVAGGKFEYDLGAWGDSFVVPAVYDEDDSVSLEIILTLKDGAAEKKLTIDGVDYYFDFVGEEGSTVWDVYEYFIGYYPVGVDSYEALQGFSDTENGEALNSETPLTAGMTLYSCYSKFPTLTILSSDGYSVKLPLNDEFINRNMLSYDENFYFRGTYSPVGYDFLGYYTSPSFSPESKVETYTGEPNVTGYLVDVTADAVLYAKVAKVSYFNIHTPQVPTYYPIRWRMEDIITMRDSNDFFNALYNIIGQQAANEYIYYIKGEFGSPLEGFELAVEGIYLDPEFTVPFTEETVIRADFDFDVYVKFDDQFITIDNTDISLHMPSVVPMSLYNEWYLEYIGGAELHMRNVTFEKYITTNCFIYGLSAIDNDKEIVGIYLDPEFTVPFTELPEGDFTLYPKVDDIVYLTLDDSDYELCPGDHTFRMWDWLSYNEALNFDVFKQGIEDCYVIPDGYEIDEIYTDAAHNNLLTELPEESVTLYITVREIKKVYFDNGSYCEWDIESPMPLRDFLIMPVADVSEAEEFLIASNYVYLLEEYESFMEIEGIYLNPEFTEKLTAWPTESITLYVNVICHHDYQYVDDGDDLHHRLVCRICGEELAASTEEHSWDAGEITTAPNCTEAGVRTFTCTKCGAEKYQSVDALGHEYTVYDHDESEHWLICVRCDDPKDAPHEAHSWDAGVVTTAPNCTEAGVRTFTCTKCGAEKEVAEPATGHTASIDFEHDNDSHWKYCTVCYEKLGATDTTHTYNQKVVAEEYLADNASCTHGAVYYYSCECGYSNETTTFYYGDPVHSLIEEEAAAYLKTEASCTEGAVYYRHCENCLHVSAETFSGEPLGHDFTSHDDDYHYCSRPGCASPKFQHSFDGRACTQCDYVSPYTRGLTFEMIRSGDNVNTYWVNIPSSVTDTDIIIPAEYKGTAVTEVDSNASNYTKQRFVSVTIPEGVKVIRTSAFCPCTSLTTVTLPSTLEKIYDTAFSGCSSLTSIELPNSLTLISQNAFYNCTALTSISIPNSVTSIERWAFDKCRFTSIRLPAGPISIDAAAFTFPEAFDLSSLYIFYEGTAEEWATISYATSGPANILNRVYTYSASVPTLEDSRHWFLLDDVPTVWTVFETDGHVLGESPEWMYDDTHHWATCATPHCGEVVGYAEHSWGAGEVTTPASCNAVGNRRFTCSVCGATKDEELPMIPHTFGPEVRTEPTWDLPGEICKTCSVCEYEDITDIPHLTGSSGLVYSLNGEEDTYTVIGYTGDDPVVYIPNTYANCPVTAIEGTPGFMNNTTITKIDIQPGGVTQIGANAFYGCTNLVEVLLPSDVTVIHDYAFYNCQNLENIYADPENPHALTRIGVRAFFAANKLNSILVDGKLVIALDAFKDAPDVRVDYLGDWADWAKNVTCIYDTSNKDTISKLYADDVLVSDIDLSGSGITEIKDYAFRGLPIESINLTGVKKIGEDAFSYCSLLTSINLIGVEYIDDRAFQNSGLTSLTIPVSVTYIGDHAFDQIPALLSAVNFVEKEGWGWRCVRDWESLYTEANTSIVEDWMLYFSLRRGVTDVTPTTYVNLTSEAPMDVASDKYYRFELTRTDLESDAQLKLIFRDDNGDIISPETAGFTAYHVSNIVIDDIQNTVMLDVTDLFTYDEENGCYVSKYSNGTGDYNKLICSDCVYILPEADSVIHSIEVIFE